MVAGDFNVTDATALYRSVIAAGLRDAYAEANGGLGFTFHIFARYRGLPWSPCLRLDYVFHTAHFQAQGDDGGERGPTRP
ncbi:MAG: endonuclease/exonuclease/phosphatase family protein [Planctomycetota bacterium]